MNKQDLIGHMGAVIVECSYKSYLVGKIVKGVLWDEYSGQWLLVESDMDISHYRPDKYAPSNYPMPQWTVIGETHLALEELAMGHTRLVYFKGCPLRTKFLKEQANG